MYLHLECEYSEDINGFLAIILFPAPCMVYGN